MSSNSAEVVCINLKKSMKSPHPIPLKKHPQIASFHRPLGNCDSPQVNKPCFTSQSGFNL